MQYVRIGSKADLTVPKSNFRFTPESRLKSDDAACPKRAKGGSPFKVLWAGKWSLTITLPGFDHRGGRRGLRLDPDIIGEAKPTAARSAADLSAPKRGMCRRPAIRSAVNHL
jgi:hypothetical protein